MTIYGTQHTHDVLLLWMLLFNDPQSLLARRHGYEYFNHMTYEERGPLHGSRIGIPITQSTIKQNSTVWA